MKTALSIAGFDPSSGAGVTADLKVFAAHGLFGTACITALTVQSTLGVVSSHPVDPAIILETLRCLDADLPPEGIKIGMIASAANISAIIEYCVLVNRLHSRRSQVPVVLDPVIRSSSGRELIDVDGLRAMRQHLLPVVDWITPNLGELAMLSGERVETREDIPRVSRLLQGGIANNGHRGRIGIVVTGGHHDPPDDHMLMPSGEEFWFPGTRIETAATHGTGCAFSSAFLSHLVRGDSPYDACRAAKDYVKAALSNGIEIGHGRHPINHLEIKMKVRD